MSQIIRAWHFHGTELRGGRPIPAVGEWLEHPGPVIPCQSGLHASRRVFDALSYAPGFYLSRVEISGEIKSHGNPEDKVVGSRRRILVTVHAREVLREFACSCALDVLHLWKAPEVVVKYLTTRDPSLRAAAEAAAAAAEAEAAEAAEAEADVEAALTPLATR